MNWSLDSILLQQGRDGSIVYEKDDSNFIIGGHTSGNTMEIVSGNFSMENVNVYTTSTRASTTTTKRMVCWKNGRRTSCPPMTSTSSTTTVSTSTTSVGTSTVIDDIKLVNI